MLSISVMDPTSSNFICLLGEEGVEALEALLQLVHRGGVGESEMLRGAEGLSGHHNDSGFAQQALGEIVHRGRELAAADIRADVGIGVEGAARHGAGHSGNSAKLCDYEVTAAAGFRE